MEHLQYNSHTPGPKVQILQLWTKAQHPFFLETLAATEILSLQEWEECKRIGVYALYEQILVYLEAAGVPLPRVGTEIDETTRQEVSTAIQRALMEVEEERRASKAIPMPGMSTFGTIRHLSNHLLYSAQAKNM